MRVLFFFLAFTLSHLGYSNTELRKMWFQLDDASQKKIFIEKAEKLNPQSPSIAAFKAAAIMMKAEFTAQPNEKIRYFNAGKDALEMCLAKNQWNTDCRFIRLTLQCKSPWFLGYHDNIEEDAQVVLDHLRLKYINTKIDFWKNAVSFMLVQSAIPKEIKTQLQQYQ
jgi:hypothetical protein